MATSVSGPELPSSPKGVEANANRNLIAHWNDKWSDLGYRCHSVATRAETGS